ncbi:MAG: enoyl-CoA hydratase-related protein [Pseudomonadota bacterium]|uniref:enoyl-CoA hydratase-related protein n=1 Tax=Polaromonas sp. TaxID=1869339 RepID=UPI0017EE84FA|nr:enoyl-CoA hydratase-related protein [Polaromonas sp.]MBA3595524.1 enoyl-CoA hydratase/isomerase family protein [Polaromonas sp.]MDQ3271773.1 enoyl-CoA hydratase-related protein [Pseudomonadota bacterium]
MTQASSDTAGESTVLYAEHGAVALLTLNRPEALNSFSPAMHHALWSALDRIQADKKIRALVLTGAGRGFCAGADLSQFDMTPGLDLVRRADPGPVIEKLFNPTIRKLQALRVPTIAAVNGVAAGAGASVAMACDLAIAAPGATFIQAFVRLGLIPDAGGSWFLVKKLGLARAMGCAMLGNKVSAGDAKEWGMIWDVVPQGVDCVERALEVAQQLAVLPTQGLVATRELLRAAASNDLDAQLDLERDTQSALGKTHDFIEGVTAFREKRPAQFKGE